MIDSTKTVLCMFSGGIDSTGVIDKLFTDPKLSQSPLIINHVIIQNRENRAKAEASAVQSILNYYKGKFPKREFTFTNVTFGTLGFAPLKSEKFADDSDICAFIAGNISVVRKDIGYIFQSDTKTTLSNLNDKRIIQKEK